MRKVLLTIALFVALLPINVFGTTESDLYAREYNYTAYLKFVDEDGAPVSGGTFESDWKTVNSTGVTEIWEISPDKTDMISAASTIEPPVPEYSPNLQYFTENGMIANSRCSVWQTDQYMYKVHILDQSYNGTIHEIKTPEGYVPISGFLKFKLEANADNDGARIIQDTTGSAYVDGNTIYIVYHKASEKPTEDESNNTETQSKPSQQPAAQTIDSSKPADTPKTWNATDNITPTDPAAIMSSVTVKIRKPKLTKKGLLVRWKKPSKANRKSIGRYQIQISKKKNFANPKTYNAAKTASSKLIRNHSKNAKYYVRVRAVKKYNGKSFVSAWSKVRSIRMR